MSIGVYPRTKDMRTGKHMLGRKMSEDNKRKLIEANTGRPSAMKGRHHSEEAKRKISKANSGSNSHLWKGGITDENKRIRRGIEFRLWREAVFARDNWTCQFCNKRGGELHPDHIKQFAFHEDLRFAIDNGRTLCKECHMSLPTTRSKKHICC